MPSLDVFGGPERLHEIRDFLRAAAEEYGADAAAVGELVLAVDEAVTNTMVHGYGRESGLIRVTLQRCQDQLVVTLEDQAVPFDPRTLPSPDLTLPIDERPIGGLGVHLMRTLTDELDYRPGVDGGNVLILSKRCFGQTSEQS